MAVPSVVKVKPGGYSVASDIKNTGGTVKVKPGGYSVAQDPKTTVQSGYVPISTKSGPKSSGKKISAQEQDLINRGFVLKGGSYYNPAIEAESKRQNAINDAIRKKKQAELAAAKQPVKYPDIVVGSGIRSTAQTQPIAPVQPVKAAPTPTTKYYTAPKTYVPTPVAPSYAKTYVENIKQTQNKIVSVSKPLPTKSRAGVAGAVPIVPVSTKPNYYNIPKTYIPSIVSPSYAQKYQTPAAEKIKYYKAPKYIPSPVSPQNAMYYTQRFDKIKPDSGTVIKEMVAPVNTLTYSPSQQKDILANIRYNEQTEAKNAMNLGSAEKYASKYETYVEKVSAAYGKSIGKITNPAMGSFVAGGTSAFLATPISIPRMVTGIVKNPIATVRETVIGTGEGLVKNPTRTLGEIAGSAVGGKIVGGVGGKGASKINKNLPKIQPATLSEIKKGGASAIYDQVKYGKQLVVMQKPLISKITPTKQIKPFSSIKDYVKENYKFGASPAPAKLTQGKSIVAFGKTETANFFETIKRNPIEYDFFKTSYDLTKQIQKTKQPVYKAGKFKVTSKDIPEKARSHVEDAVRSYKGNIEIKGSISQQMQIGQYMRRQPADIEIFVDNPAKFASHIDTYLKKAGTPYTIDGKTGKSPKVHFGKEKGIEIFEIADSTPYNAIEGYVPNSPLPYTYKTFKPIRTDNVKIMNIREQVGRKAAGGNILSDNKIGPQHSGRLKDVGDFTDISTGYAIETNLKASNLVAKFNEQARARYSKMIHKDQAGNIIKVPESTYYRKLYTELDKDFKPVGGFGFEPVTKTLYSKSVKSFVSPLDLQGNTFIGIRPVNTININSDRIKKAAKTQMDNIKAKPLPTKPRTINTKSFKTVGSIDNIKKIGRKDITTKAIDTDIIKYRGFDSVIKYPKYKNIVSKPKYASITPVNIGQMKTMPIDMVNNIQYKNIPSTTRTTKPTILSKPFKKLPDIRTPPEPKIPYSSVTIPVTKPFTVTPTYIKVSKPVKPTNVKPLPPKPILPQKGDKKHSYPVIPIPYPTYPTYPAYTTPSYPTYPEYSIPSYPTYPEYTPKTEIPSSKPNISNFRPLPKTSIDTDDWIPNQPTNKSPFVLKKKKYPTYISSYRKRPSQWFIKNPVQKFMRPTVPWAEAKKKNLIKYNESYFGKWYNLKNLRGPGK